MIFNMTASMVRVSILQCTMHVVHSYSYSLTF